MARSRRSIRRHSRLLVVALCALGLATAPASVRAADTSPPTQPGPIAVSGITATSAALSWRGSRDDVGIEGYRVYRAASGDPLQLIATTDAVTSFTARNLYSGRGYRFGVTAIDSGNNESPMSTVDLTTTSSSDTTVPAAPPDTSVFAHAFSDSRIDVTWGKSGSDDVAGYEVVRDGAVVARVDPPNGLRYSDNGLAAGSRHAYVIRAVDSAANVSASSKPKSATTLAPGAATIPRGPLLSNVTGTSAIVSWWTNVPTAGVVSWGAGRSAADPAGSVRQHQVPISGLSPGTTVRYQVGDGGSLASGAFNFRTAPLPGTPFSFAAIGDFGGGGTGMTNNAANIAGAGTSFIQTVGDNVYPSAGNPDPDFATAYSDFDQRFFKPFAAAVHEQAFFPANGNKEYYGDGAFWRAFPMPGDNHAWYAYDWGDAHVLVLDSELPLARGTSQYAFAENDLATHQAARWRIVAIQRPAYSSSSATASSRAVQQNLVPLFEAQRVQLVLSGNSHNYERSFPLVGGARDPGGVTYVVTGAGGNGFNAFTIAAPAWSAFRENTRYEFLKVSVSATALRLEAVAADGGGVLDSATITAPPSGPPPPPPPPPPAPAPAPPAGGAPPPASPASPPAARPAPVAAACAARRRGGSGADHLRGTRGGDRLLGAAGNDRLEGLGGADCLLGMAGADVLRGGTGADRLWGGPGADLLVGGSGADQLWGSTGNDRLWGGTGNDRLTGGTGNDRLTGGTGNDRLTGGSGADQLWGGTGNDQLTGGSGNDRLVGGSGRDRIYGGSGRDVIDARDGSRDVVDCGPGRDVARVDRHDAVRRCERVIVSPA